MVNTVHSYIKGLPKPTTPPTPIPSNCLHLQTSLCIKRHHRNTGLFFNKQKAYQGIHITILSQNCITRRPTNLIFHRIFCSYILRCLNRSAADILVLVPGCPVHCWMLNSPTGTLDASSINLSPLPKLWQAKLSPDIGKSPFRGRITPVQKN